MKDIKVSALLVVPYLTICGVLYHVAYWSRFNLNGLSFINASDIVKSATIPILPGLLIYAICLIVLRIIGFYRLFPIKTRDKPRIQQYKGHNWISRGLLLFWAIWVVLGYYRNVNTFIWPWWAVFTMIPFAIYLYNNSFLRSQIADSFSRYASIQFIVLLPLMSYAIGKQDSDYVFKNEKFYYLTPVTSNSDTLKFLGITSDKVIFTNKQNAGIVMFGASLDTLRLSMHK